LKAKFLIPIQLANGGNNGRPKCFEIHTNNKCSLKKKSKVGPGSYSTPVRECCEIHCLVFVNVQIFRGLVNVHGDEVTGEWRKLHNEELNDLYSGPNIVRMIKSRNMRWAGHVARMGKGEVCTGFSWGNLREGDRWGDPGIDGRIILEWIIKKCNVGVRTGLGWLRIGIHGGRL
jgi:hypothetical protein